jgi:hypothetical protein
MRSSPKCQDPDDTLNIQPDKQGSRAHVSKLPQTVGDASNLNVARHEAPLPGPVRVPEPLTRNKPATVKHECGCPRLSITTPASTRCAI